MKNGGGVQILFGESQSMLASKTIADPEESPGGGIGGFEVGHHLPEQHLNPIMRVLLEPRRKIQSARLATLTSWCRVVA